MNQLKRFCNVWINSRKIIDSTELAKDIDNWLETPDGQAYLEGKGYISKEQHEKEIDEAIKHDMNR